MGEEHGDDAPFQFFSDHIDKRIAKATREGRRREFAAFAAFAGEEIPDPQDPATFERSKLTWKRDRRMLELHRDLLAFRRGLRGADCEVLGYDENARWLRVRRNGYELVMSFAARRSVVPVTRSEIVLSTHSGTTLEGRTLELPALAGAVLR
jgi:maltooligosyltrehalose trehalohydrolase